MVSVKEIYEGYCKYSIVSLRRTIIPDLETVTLENIHNHFRKFRMVMERCDHHHIVRECVLEEKPSRVPLAIWSTFNVIIFYLHNQIKISNVYETIILPKVSILVDGRRR